MSAKVVEAREVEAPSTRGQRLLRELLEVRGPALHCLERAKLITASYKETEGQPPPIRKARAFEKIVTQIPIFIQSEQLLVGDFGAMLKYSEWYPECDFEWIKEAIRLEDFSWLVGNQAELQEIVDYWKGRCLRHAIFSQLDEEEQNSSPEAHPPSVSSPW